MCCSLLDAIETQADGEQKLVTKKWKPCFFQKSRTSQDRGCAIYSRRPRVCRDWKCAWLRGEIPEEMYPPNVNAVFWSQEIEGTPTALLQIAPWASEENEKVALEVLDRAHKAGTETMVLRMKDV